MSFSGTVVISCAGIGSRLGMGVPKALIELHGRPLIHWQLDMLTDVEDVRVVVGFQAQKVIDAVRLVRPNTTFVFNHNFNETGTAHSLFLGAKYAHGDVISLDGDLLVHPEDFQRLLQVNAPIIGVTPVYTEEPVYVHVEPSSLATQFSYTEKSPYEWTGLTKVSSLLLKHSHTVKNVYQLLEPILPINTLHVRTCEIDTPADFNNALKWLNKFIIVKEEMYEQV